MLELKIPDQVLFDEGSMQFIYTKETVLRFEHSLVSISKWESKWKKPFMDPKRKSTREEDNYYYKCMCLTQNVDPNVISHLPSWAVEKIQSYMEDTMTATWFNEKNKPGKREIITSELIYYWMISYNIPFECQKWHINRLMTLIHVCGIKNAPEKKMTKAETYERQRQINAMRRKPKVPKS